MDRVVSSVCASPASDVGNENELYIFHFRCDIQTSQVSEGILSALHIH